MSVQGHYIDPLSDFGFKYLFHQEKHREIMIDFLNAVFEGSKKIVRLEYSPTEYVGAHEKFKKIFFDLVCTTENGEKFIVEMQRNPQKYFRDRCLFYLSRLINEQLPKGEPHWNTELKGVHLVGILEFSLNEEEKSQALSDIHLADINTQKAFFNRTGLKFLELPKFNKTEDELTTELDKWFYLFKHLGTLEHRPEKLDSPAFKMLFKIARLANLTPEELMTYNSGIKAKNDYYGTIAFAKETAKIEERKSLITGMKNKGLSSEQIANLTELSVEEINTITTSTKNL